MIAPLTPFKVLCKVEVITSAYPIGDGWKPVTIKPAIWETSAINIAPTLSAICLNLSKSIIWL